MSEESKYILAFDTSNEVIAIGVGQLDPESRSIIPVVQEKAAAHRASNTQLVPRIDRLLSDAGVERSQIACIAVGRGPGSFTGVRIAIATAKGIASALGVGLVGVSTQESIAWGAWASGVRGDLLVTSDAMRKEIYPARFLLEDAGVERMSPDRVVKADVFVEKSQIRLETASDACMHVTGDALLKFHDALSSIGETLPEDLWTPSGEGLLMAVQHAWRSGEADPVDAQRQDPMLVLPVYTRLSDAEEGERAKLASPGVRNLVTGVQGNKASGVITEKAAPAGTYDSDAVSVRPLDVSFAPSVAALESDSMGTDAWSEPMFVDDLGRSDRSWWMAVKGGVLVGYAGIRLAGDEAELLKVAVDPGFRRSGVATRLLERLAYDAQNLAAESMLLEVRAGNHGAKQFYESMGFEEVGSRPRYYSDGEDASILRARVRDIATIGADGTPAEGDVESREAQRPFSAGECSHPLILAIESSCDETAAAVIDGDGRILASVVSSQVEFHARFGGVVPEIASRKHVESIVGVCRMALDQAAGSLGVGSLSWHDLDAVGVTYAPGLVGALVVGVAFAKGAAWAADIPVVAVNHLEGHLYANKLAENGEGFKPPAVVSLVSGGNTMLVHMKGWQDYEILGQTIDDAVGEAFDKVAKALGLPYPGGPQISRLAKGGNPDAIDFPRALMHSGDYRFSLSGLKTAVLTYIAQVQASGEELKLDDICASFQQAVVDVQVGKAARALEETGASVFCLGGGVAANPALRKAYEDMCESKGVTLVMPPLSACGDNAAMIALVALDRYRQGRFAALDQDAYARADLSKPY